MPEECRPEASRTIAVIKGETGLVLWSPPVLLTHQLLHGLPIPSFWAASGSLVSYGSLAREAVPGRYPLKHARELRETRP